MKTRARSVNCALLSIATVALFCAGCSPDLPYRTAPEPELAEDDELASDVDYVGQYLDLGQAYYDEGRYADAVDQFQAALEMNPYSDEAHAGMGMAYYHLGKPEQAETSFRRALRLNDRNVVARNGIAMVSEDEQERAAQLEAAIAYEPSTELHQNYGVIMFQAGNYDRAVDEATRAIEMDSANAHAYYTRGYAYQQQGRLDMALAEYRRALDLRPNWDRVLNNMALVYYYKSEFGYSIDYYKQAIAVNSSEATFHFNLALAYEAMASRLQSRASRDPGSGDPSEWRNLYYRAANELNTYLRLKPDADDANRIRSRINDLRRTAR